MSRNERVTELTSAAERGDEQAAEELFVALYDELRHIADRMLRREEPGHTLQPTALVHEVYQKLVDPARLNINGTTHFRAIAARAMQQVLIDHARGKNRQKRGGGPRGPWHRVALNDASLGGQGSNLDVSALHEALERLRERDPQAARVVELRVLSDQTHAENAGLLGISARTVKREGAVGREWLKRELMEDEQHERS
jgi:RNA polymerase sigma-70 factor, ECF subfamily